MFVPSTDTRSGLTPSAPEIEPWSSVVFVTCAPAKEKHPYHVSLALSKALFGLENV